MALESDEDFVRLLGIGQEELSASLNGSYAAVMKWSSPVAIEFGESGEDSLALTLGNVGNVAKGRVFPNCSNLVELDLMLAASSASGALNFRLPAMATLPGGATKNAFIATTYDRLAINREDGDAGSLAVWLESASSHAMRKPEQVDVALRIREGVLSGEVSLSARSVADCRVVTFGESSRCQAMESALETGSEVRQLSVEELEHQVNEQLPSRAMYWSDTGARTTVGFHFDADENDACAEGLAQEAATARMSVGGRLRVTTDDGRLSVTIGGRASTTAAEGLWRQPEIVASEWNLREGTVQGWNFAEGSIPVVEVDQRPSGAAASVIIEAFRPLSAGINLTSPRCGPSEMWGVRSPVASLLPSEPAQVIAPAPSAVLDGAEVEEEEPEPE